VIRYRKHQKRLGTRKLLEEIQDFFTTHRFKIGRDAMFDLLSEYGLLVKNHNPRNIPNLREYVYKALAYYNDLCISQNNKKK